MENNGISQELPEKNAKRRISYSAPTLFLQHIWPYQSSDNSPHLHAPDIYNTCIHMLCYDVSYMTVLYFVCCAVFGGVVVGWMCNGRSQIIVSTSRVDGPCQLMVFSLGISTSFGVVTNSKCSRHLSVTRSVVKSGVT